MAKEYFNPGDLKKFGNITEHQCGVEGLDSFVHNLQSQGVTEAESFALVVPHAGKDAEDCFPGNENHEGTVTTVD